ncbi:MAG: HAD hydrolase family protein, partial [Bacillota bacterium]
RNGNHPDIAANERISEEMPVHMDVLGDGLGMPVEGVYKVTIMFEDAALAERLHPEIESEFASLHHAHSASTWLEFTARGASKLRGVRYVARMLGVSRRDVMAIGDNENDLEMIRWAGMGIYVDSAPAALKAFARLAPPPGVSAVAWGLTQLVAGAIPVPSAGRAAGARLARPL